MCIEIKSYQIEWCQDSTPAWFYVVCIKNWPILRSTCQHLNILNGLLVLLMLLMFGVGKQKVSIYLLIKRFISWKQQINLLRPNELVLGIMVTNREAIFDKIMWKSVQVYRARIFVVFRTSCCGKLTKIKSLVFGYNHYLFKWFTPCILVYGFLWFVIRWMAHYLKAFIKLSHRLHNEVSIWLEIIGIVCKSFWRLFFYFRSQIAISCQSS